MKKKVSYEWNYFTIQSLDWFCPSQQKRCLGLLNLSVPGSPMCKNPLTQLQIENDEKDAKMLYIQTMVVSRQTFKCNQTREFGKGFCIVKAERTHSNHAKQKQQTKRTGC